MNLSRSSIGLHSFQGIFALPQKADGVTHVSGMNCPPLSQEGHKITPADDDSDPIYKTKTAVTEWEARSASCELHGALLADAAQPK
jgi:hypothetical protein